MPVPIILGAFTVAATGLGATSSVLGIKKVSKANVSMQDAELEHRRNIRRFERQNAATNNQMDQLGKRELWIIYGFKEFSRSFEKIHNRPEFDDIEIGDSSILKYDPEDLKKCTVGAGVLIGALEGAAVGTAGAFAISGATTAAVTAVGAASTGTAISSLHGIALTNAVLAQLGGGSISVGGGGMALGATLLDALSMGTGILVGGIIFLVTGCRLSKKAGEAVEQVEIERMEVEKLCNYLEQLENTSKKYEECLKRVQRLYKQQARKFFDLVEKRKKRNWEEYTQDEKRLVENLVGLVMLLFNMCKLKLAKKQVVGNETELGVYSEGVDRMIYHAEDFMDQGQMCV